MKLCDIFKSVNKAVNYGLRVANYKLVQKWQCGSPHPRPNSNLWGGEWARNHPHSPPGIFN